MNMRWPKNTRPSVCARTFSRWIGYGFGLLVVCGLISLHVQADPNNPIGVIVHCPTNDLTPLDWKALTELNPTPEILYVPSSKPSPAGQAPFDFDSFNQDLLTYSQHGFQVAVSVTPHILTIPAAPQVDETGQPWAERQNPYDPAFVSEWERLLREFCAGPQKNRAITRLYLNPPSYYGEVEYYMGEDWNQLKFLAYGPHARARFVQWLEARYQTPQAVGLAWGESLESWEALRLPAPPEQARDILGGQANAWIDFMQWRSEYLTSLIAQELKLCTTLTDKEVGIKVAWGDTTAYHATDTGAILSRCSGPNNLFLHSTNGHSSVDLAYAQNLKRHYNLCRLVTENDGGRYGRSELAKITLNCMFYSVDEFNFAHFGHLTESTGGGMTESKLALASARQALQRDLPSPPQHPIAFFHSSLTRNFRAPKFFNKDVGLVYDQLLSNERPYFWWNYSWARWLTMPDVTGEQLILDGDLEGRRMLIVPNTSFTVWPQAVRERVMRWVEAGGTLVGFGSEALCWQANDQLASGQQSRCRHVLDFDDPGSEMGESPLEITPGGRMFFGESPWVVADHPAPVWLGPLPSAWESLLTDGQGRTALAMSRLGLGRMILFPQPVPILSKPQDNPFYQHNVPLILRALADQSQSGLNVQFSKVDDPSGQPVAPLAVRYLGQDSHDRAHLFVGGADNESAARVCLKTIGLTGQARLILVDMGRLTASYASGEGRPSIKTTRPQEGRTIMDPTNVERDESCLIPVTEISFEASRPLVIGLGPQ